MTRRHRRRLFFAAALLAGGALAAVLTAAALKDTVLYFYTPADVAAHKIGAGVAFRIGGVVKPGSVQKKNGGIRFVVTDGKADVPVEFKGTPPALFAEGAGIVAAGKLSSSDRFEAGKVLARHDEKYMPPAVAAALKRSGR